jgi:cell division protease FtsH
VGHFTPGADPVQKVSIVPRGIGALGYTLQTPLEDRFLMSRSELIGKIKGLLGGRAAEEIVFGEVSTGASNDLEKIAKIARNMITVYGMSRHAPNISLVDHQQDLFLGQGPGVIQHSEKLEQMIDDETQEIVRTCYADAKQMITEKRDKLEKLAHRLLEKEKMDEQEIIAVLGPRAA